jgi:transcription-repair coupling factor (superfamily II helicase)
VSSFRLNACFSDHQIFERYHNLRLKSDVTKKQALSLKELTQMEVGDYVTHIDHGIGKFGGLQKMRSSNQSYRKEKTQ